MLPLQSSFLQLHSSRSSRTEELWVTNIPPGLAQAVPEQGLGAGDTQGLPQAHTPLQLLQGSCLKDIEV